MDLPFTEIILPPWILCICAAATACLVTYLAIPVIVRIAKTKGLVDHPNHRTSHNGSIPSLGGIAIFAGLLMGSTLFIPEVDLRAFRYILPSVIIVFFIGQKDDIEALSARTKLMAQLIAAFLIVVMADYRIFTLHGFLGKNDIGDFSSIFLSMILILVIVNAFNLIDGIDGLASGIGILTAGVLGLWLFGLEQYGMAVIAAALVGGLIPFFIFNVFGKKNKLFMGDTGSLVIGLIVSIFTLNACGIEQEPEHLLHMKATPSVAIAILIYPLFDLLRIFFRRTLSGKSPFSPDRGHIHHLFIDAGVSHRRSTFYILVFNLAAIIWAWIFRNSSILFLGLTLLGWAIMGTITLRLIGKRKTRE